MGSLLELVGCQISADMEPWHGEFFGYRISVAPLKSVSAFSSTDSIRELFAWHVVVLQPQWPAPPGMSAMVYRSMECVQQDVERKLQEIYENAVKCGED